MKRARYGVAWDDSTPSIVPFVDGEWHEGPFTLAEAKRSALAGLQQSVDQLRSVMDDIRAVREVDVFETEALFEVTP